MIREEIKKALEEELCNLRQDIINNHIDAGQRASGKTIESLRVEVSENEGSLYGRKDFDNLELGRKPGETPLGFVQIIYKWMKAKGIHSTPIPYVTNRQHKYTPQERGDMRLAYLIARKIRREGTLLFRNGGRNDIYSNLIPGTIEKIRELIKGFLQVELKESIKINNIKE